MFWRLWSAREWKKEKKMAEKHPAMLWEAVADESRTDTVRCNLCAHHCLIRAGRKGICLVRENVGGELKTLVYGRVISANVDPVEKKPLFHFHPGTGAFSIATIGCNYRCQWCQNWQISQAAREEHITLGSQPATPSELVAMAQRTGCRSIAYTYTEPTIFFEYAYDTAKLAHDAGIANVFVTNGYMTAEALETIRPYLDAANVDLKAFRDETYRKLIGAQLQPVLDSLVRMKEAGVWVEVTTLVITDLNDSDDELRQIATFVHDELGPDTPWHVSRYHPTYKYDAPPTPVDRLARAWNIGKEVGLYYVFVGNVPGSLLPRGVEGESTYCHNCGAVLIRRWGYSIRENRVQDGACPDCSTAVAGVGLG
jgi:pyruvate formate lyase activating enzyme